MRHTCTNKRNSSEKRSTFDIYMNTDCLLKNMSTKHIKYLGDQKLEHINDISVREPRGSV